jgi:hypothetical protein
LEISTELVHVRQCLFFLYYFSYPGCKTPEDPVPVRSVRLPGHPDEQPAQAFQVQAWRGLGRCRRSLVPMSREKRKKKRKTFFLLKIGLFVDCFLLLFICIGWKLKINPLKAEIRMFYKIFSGKINSPEVPETKVPL